VHFGELGVLEGNHALFSLPSTVASGLLILLLVEGASLQKVVSELLGVQSHRQRVRIVQRLHHLIKLVEADLRVFSLELALKELIEGDLVGILAVLVSIAALFLGIARLVESVVEH
jgi:hypothetical protein